MMVVDPESRPRVAIAGGGLAGLTCAKLLADAGCAVTLLEREHGLGGRASTFRDDDGDWIEQGLHLFHGSYTEFHRLLRSLGLSPHEILYFTDYVRFEQSGGPSAMFGTNLLYAPLLTLRSIFANNHYLGPRAKLELLRIVAPALLPTSLLRRFDDRSVAGLLWARSSGSKQLRERILRPFCRALQFTELESFSAYNFLGTLHQALLRPLRSRQGGFRGPSEALVFQPFATYLQQLGVEIRTGVEVGEILYSAERREITGFVLAGGEQLSADVYVVALPQWVFVDKLPTALRELPFFAKITRLPVAPAISVQLWLDRVVTKLDGFTLVADSLAPVYQDQARLVYPYAQGSRLSVIVSPADEMLDWDDDAITQYVMTNLGRANPEIEQSKIVKRVVLKHPRHLLRPLPGAMSTRPTQATPIANLFLAGDWTQQEFFGSQEGAVRSGKACARAILRASVSKTR